MSSLKIKSSTPRLACHPQALPAFEFTQFIFLLRGVSTPSRHRIALVARATKLGITVVGGSEVFIEGWMPLLFSHKGGRKTNYPSNISNIESRSWTYALQAALVLSHKRDCIRHVGLFFEHAPIYVQARFFDGRLPSTTLAKTQEFLGENRSVVRNALKGEVRND